MQNLDLLLHFGESLVASLYEVDVFVSFVLHDVVQRRKLLEAVVRVVAPLREVCYHELLHLHLRWDDAIELGSEMDQQNFDENTLIISISRQPPTVPS